MTLRFKVNLFATQGIYFIVYGPVSPNKYTPFYQSEIQLKTFHWEAFRLNKFEQIVVEFYKSPDNNGKSKLLGSSNIILANLSFQSKYDINKRKSRQGVLSLTQF